MSLPTRNKFYRPFNCDWVFDNQQYHRGNNIAGPESKQLTFYDEYGIINFINNEDLLVADVIPAPYKADPTQENVYNTNSFVLQNPRPISNIKNELISKLSDNCFEYQTVLIRISEERKILYNLPKPDVICKALKGKFDMFDEFKIDGKKFFKADINGYLKSEIEIAQTLFSDALKADAPDVEELRAIYTSKSTNIDRDYNKILAKLNESIMLYNIEQLEYQKLNKRFDLIFDEPSGFIYIKKLGSRSFDHYTLYIYLIWHFAIFLENNVANA
jgi:hypothetical protein